MILTDVIESFIEEQDLPKDLVIAAICEGMQVAYTKKFPLLDVVAHFNKKTGQLEAFAKKKVVSKVEDENKEIALRKAKVIVMTASEGDIVEVPIEEKVGRIEILAAKQIIASKVRELEALAISKEFKDKEGTIVSGTVYKKEFSGFSVKIGSTVALLPNSCSIPEEILKVGFPIRALLKEVLVVPRGGYQLILDRASSDFVKKLLELEIPEIYEGTVEIKKIVRSPGYKTKAIMSSNNKEIDPVGTCVGVGGSRIKPILKELNNEKIDLIEFTNSQEELVKYSLKPAEIDKVEIGADGVAVVLLAQDQRSFAIGKAGKNIILASALVGIPIKLQEVVAPSQAPALEMELQDDTQQDDIQGEE